MKQNLSVFAVCMLLCMGVFAQKPVELKFHLNKGENYNYNLNMDIETKGNFGGQDVDVNNKIGIGYVFTSLGDSAGWTKMSSTIANISMNINVGGVNVSYNSNEPVDTSNIVSSTLGQVLGALKGGQFQFTINEQGEVGTVSGFSDMMQKVTSAAAGAGQLGSAGNAFNEDNFRQNLQQTFGAYPSKPVKPGDTWSSVTNATNGGVAIKTENTYTLESVSGNSANVKVEGKLSTPASAEGTSVSGISTGNIQYDIPSGIATGGLVDSNLKMTISQQGQTIPMTTDIKMKIDGKKS